MATPTVAGPDRAHLLAAYRIHVWPRFVPTESEGIRITPNVLTTLGEVDVFTEAIEQIVAGA